MLSPRYLDGLSDELVEIYSQLETDILQDMARRVKRLGKITDATKWQAQMLAEAGGLKANIGKTLKNYDKKIIAEVTRTYTEALRKSTENDNKIFVKALGRTVKEPNAQMMLATIQKCHSDLSRLTLTTAATSETLFVQQANRVYMDTQSGAFDYDTAMKGAADAMAERGITTVQYRNGRPVTLGIESAIRMNILASVNQTAANMTMNNCEELGCDLVETSAHIGARPEHEEWQGQIFSRSGTNPKYRPFSVCELGSPTGICGINCRHSFYPYFEGMHGHYTQDDLDEMADEKVTYNGKEMTRYEGEQAQRKIERQIRYYKRRALTEEAAGVDNTAARVKLGEWQAKARDFTQQTGLRRDAAREFIGTKDGVQPTRMTKRELEIKGGFKTGRSVGAMARRFLVDVSESKNYTYQDDFEYRIKDNTEVHDVDVIAKGNNIKCVNRLIKNYPKSNGDLTSPKSWYKVKGIGIITNGTEEREAELHWYENTDKSIGKVEFKKKRWLDEQ